VIGTLALGPYKSWGALVNVATGATAIMYAFAPIALAALQRSDAARPRPYRVPMPGLVLPLAFCCANLIVYWGGFGTTWRLALAMVFGLALFSIGVVRSGSGAGRTLRNAVWMAPWLGGHVVIGALGRYGDGATNILPEWVDIAVVIGFSLAIFYWALAVALSSEAAAAMIAKDVMQLDFERQ
jgi:amino acid transporter